MKNGLSRQRGGFSSHALGLICLAHHFFVLAFLLTACDEFIVNFILKYLQNYVIFNFAICTFAIIFEIIISLNMEIISFLHNFFLSVYEI